MDIYFLFPQIRCRPKHLLQRLFEEQIFDSLQTKQREEKPLPTEIFTHFPTTQNRQLAFELVGEIARIVAQSLKISSNDTGRGLNSFQFQLLVRLQQ
jgi:hypothetical protein